MRKHLWDDIGGLMTTITRYLAAAGILAFLTAGSVSAQVAPDATRFAVAAAPVLSQPKGDFRRNVGNGFGGGAGVQYYADRRGFFSLRFDVSAVAYGHEEKRVPTSERISDHALK